MHCIDIASPCHAGVCDAGAGPASDFYFYLVWNRLVYLYHQLEKCMHPVCGLGSIIRPFISGIKSTNVNAWPPARLVLEMANSLHTIDYQEL